MLRSEPMQLVQIISDNESARAVVTALGDAALVHFRDLNGETPMHRRAFAAEMKKADEMTRRLGFLSAQVQSAGLQIPSADEAASSQLPGLDKVEQQLRQAQVERLEGRAQETQVSRAHNALKEHLHCLALGATIFDGDRAGMSSALDRKTRASREGGGEGGGGLGASLLENAFPTGAGSAGASDGSMLHVLAGTVNRQLTTALVRAVHRVTRGNSVVHETPISEELLGVPQEANSREAVPMAKNFVLIVYSGNVLHAKVRKSSGGRKRGPTLGLRARDTTNTGLLKSLT